MWSGAGQTSFPVPEHAGSAPTAQACSSERGFAATARCAPAAPTAASSDIGSGIGVVPNLEDLEHHFSVAALGDEPAEPFINLQSHANLHPFRDGVDRIGSVLQFHCGSKLGACERLEA